jgi:hypothetical protein
MAPTGRELEMRTGSGDPEEYTVVTRVIPESTDLGEAEAIAVESDDFVEPTRMPSDPHLDRLIDERRHAD